MGEEGSDCSNFSFGEGELRCSERGREGERAPREETDKEDGKGPDVSNVERERERGREVVEFRCTVEGRVKESQVRRQLINLLPSLKRRSRVTERGETTEEPIITLTVYSTTGDEDDPGREREVGSGAGGVRGEARESERETRYCSGCCVGSETR